MPTPMKYLWTYRRRGLTLAYYRRGGITKRLRDPNGKPVTPADGDAFRAAYAAADAAASKPRPKPGDIASPRSLAALIDAYKASAEWAQLALASQKDYDKVLIPLRKHKKATLPVATIPRAFVFSLRDEYSSITATDEDGKETTRQTPRRANRVVAVFSLLMKWGVNRGWRKDNPATAMGKLRTGPGYATWRPGDFVRFMVCDGVGEPLKRAAALGYYTGQRKQDCLAMLKGARQDGVIEVTPIKTERVAKGATVWVPEHPELTRTLDAAPATDDAHVLTRADGKPWGEDHFNHQFAAAVKLAGLPDGYGFHGLRKALSADLAASGATDAEMDAIVYHSNPSMSRLYRQAADRKALARSAMAKLVKGKAR